METCVKCGCTSLGYHYLVDGERWCCRCLPIEVTSLRQRLAAAEAAARFYARYYDGPSEALLGEADRKAFMWIENDANEVNP